MGDGGLDIAVAKAWGAIVGRAGLVRGPLGVHGLEMKMDSPSCVCLGAALTGPGPARTGGWTVRNGPGPSHWAMDNDNEPGSIRMGHGQS